MRSFLRHNGLNSLPKANLAYTLQEWHRAYKAEEGRKLLSYLDGPFHKLYVYKAVESGLGAQKILDIKYRHIKEDLEAGLEEVAVRFEPSEYSKKSAGFTFLGKRSVGLVRELIAKGRAYESALPKLVNRLESIEKELQDLKRAKKAAE